MSTHSPYLPPAGSIPTLLVPGLQGIESVHMIGIGGAGMRNLAKLLLARGIGVSGSDLKDSKGLRELSDAGAQVYAGNHPERLGSPDAVIVSTAIHEGDPELLAAREKGIEVWARAQALAAAAEGRRCIAVAGTHGKTTTTSMIATILERSGLDPTFVVGGDLNESGSGARAGAGDIFLAEADESDGSFLLFRPEIGVVTNIEVDHVDFYTRGRDEIEEAFAAFLARCSKSVVYGDDPAVHRSLTLAGGVDATTYGTDPKNDVGLTVVSAGPGGAVGRVSIAGAEVALNLRVDGAHNLLDATAALTTSWLAGVDPAAAGRALGEFAGVHRRFEWRGSAGGAEFFDDYGHVPTELAVTLEVARRMAPRRLVAVFQPHRYSRTKALWRELGSSLLEADLIVVTDVYGAGQDPIPGVTGELIVKGITDSAPGKRVVYCPHRAEVARFLSGEVQAGDLVITLGCGDVWMLGDEAMERIRESG